MKKSVLLSETTVTEEGSIDFSKLKQLDTGDIVEGSQEIVSFEEYIEMYPDSFNGENISEIKEAISDYQAEIEEMWKAAKENKGSIQTKGWGGSSSKSGSADEVKETSVTDFNKMYGDVYNHYYEDGKHEYKYGPCGASATGYILDTLVITGRGKVDEKWLKMSNVVGIDKKYSECTEYLIDLMDMTPLGDQYITWPQNIGKGIENLSNYKTTFTATVPKKSLNDGIPGINLKLGKYKKGLSFHYRNVIGYEMKGWWAFSWPRMKIKDLNGLDHGWETYNPIIHWGSWNVVKR